MSVKGCVRRCVRGIGCMGELCWSVCALLWGLSLKMCIDNKVSVGPFVPLGTQLYFTKYDSMVDDFAIILSLQMQTKIELCH